MNVVLVLCADLATVIHCDWGVNVILFWNDQAIQSSDPHTSGKSVHHTDTSKAPCLSVVQSHAALSDGTLLATCVFVNWFRSIRER